MKYIHYPLKICLVLNIFIFANVDYELKKKDCCNGDEGKLCYPVKLWRWCHCLCLSDDKK